MKSRAPLLELTLFVSDPAVSATFFSSLGFHCEPWPESGDTTIDVTLGSREAPIIQLFQANDQYPVTRCQLGFQVADLVKIAEALDCNGFGWECPRPNHLATRDPDGNRTHITVFDT